MSLMEKFEMEEATLPFKIFVPRSSSRFRSESSVSVSSSTTSKLNLTVGSPLMSSSSSPQQLLSPDGGDGLGDGLGDGEGSTRCFDFTGLRRLAPRALPSELLLASSSPSSSTRLMNSDQLFQLRPDAAGFSGDPNLPKRLHVSNIPFRYREHNLVMLFGKFGNVEDAEIIYNDKGSKGFGFVTMSRGKDADHALLRLNHSIVEGRIIEVNLATPKVIGLKKTPDDSGPPGVFYLPRKVPGPPSPSSPYSSSPQDLLQAETKLAEAKMEVFRIRKQMKMERFRCQSTSGLDMSSLHL